MKLTLGQFLFSAVFAFATGVLVYDIAQDPPMPPAEPPYIQTAAEPSPYQARVMSEATAIICAHAMATGTGWRCM